MDYEEGQAIPPGYALTTKSRIYVAAIGGGVFLLAYIPTVYVAAFVTSAQVEGIEPLFAPVAGPFIAIETAKPRSSLVVAAMVGSGVVQSAGVITGIVGLLLPEEKQLYRTGAPLAVAPLVAENGLSGVALSGSF